MSKQIYDKFVATTLIEAAKLGANADVNHPLREIWEGARSYYRLTVDMSLENSYNEKMCDYLACPFCGSDHILELISPDNKSYVDIVCANCGATNPPCCGVKHHAIKLWNTRPKRKWF